MVGFVLVVGRGVYLGQCVTTPIVFFGDLLQVAWLVYPHVELPVNGFALEFSCASAVQSGLEFEVGVESSFECVCC